MKSVLIAFILLLSSVAALSQAQPNQCFTCHEQIGDTVVEKFKRDIHYSKGIFCNDCHGGDATKEEMEEAMDTSAGFRGVPQGNEIAQTCARCHSDSAMMVKRFHSSIPLNQAEDLAASVHGRMSTSGQGYIAQCVTCHNAHGIVSTKNPASPVYPLNITKTCAKCHADAAYMQTYNPALPVDQLEKYRSSIHGMKNARGDTKVAACANCHGSHNIRSAKDAKSKVYAENLPTTCGACHANAEYMKGRGIPTDQVKKFVASVHGKALLEKHDLGAPSCNDCHGNHGATPPGVESVSKVCGTCHALNADLFSSSPHKKAFDERRLPECETCHGYHDIVAATDALLGVSDDAVCKRCHSATENVKGYLVAVSMRQLTDSLKEALDHANTLVDDAEQKGMEISEERFKLRDVHQAELQSRTMVHAFNEKKFRDVVEKGLTVASSVAEEGQHSIDEYYFRRWGLGIASLIITIVAISLYLMIRRIERKQNSRM